MRTRHKLEPRWKSGIFLGVKKSTTEKIVGDAHGTYVVQSIRRVSENTRWDKELLNSIKGTPWDTTPSAEHGDLPQAISIAPEARCSGQDPGGVCPRGNSEEGLHHEEEP